MHGGVLSHGENIRRLALRPRTGTKCSCTTTTTTTSATMMAMHETTARAARQACVQLLYYVVAIFVHTHTHHVSVCVCVCVRGLLSLGAHVTATGVPPQAARRYSKRQHCIAPARSMLSPCGPQYICCHLFCRTMWQMHECRCTHRPTHTHTRTHAHRTNIIEYNRVICGAWTCVRVVCAPCKPYTSVQLRWRVRRVRRVQRVRVRLGARCHRLVTVVPLAH